MINIICLLFGHDHCEWVDDGECNGIHYEGKSNDLKVVTSYPGVFLYLHEKKLNGIKITS